NLSVFSLSLVQKSNRSPIVYAWMLVRWVVGLLLIFSGILYQNPGDLYKVMWVLFWMVPPALTSPVLSVLWGGNLYPSAILSRTLSIIAPAALIVTFGLAKQLPINSSSLIFFGVILIVGLAIPGALAQVWRDKSPVESNHHSKNWKFIGVLAVALMALATGFQFTPSTFLGDLFFSTDATRSLACLQQLAVATLIFILMRVFIDAMILTQLEKFRQAVYDCLGKAKDAVFELMDAVLTSPSIPSFVSLSQSPVFRRQWSSIYAALHDSRLPKMLLMKLLVQEVATDEQPFLAGDHSFWARPEAKTLKERTFYGNRGGSIRIGQSYSTEWH
ncbi:MAG: hypothetical protein PUQ00_19650, partial [Nostoc sp. S13]|nr:hypothetical protein [Nostoc sp. S13]